MRKRFSSWLHLMATRVYDDFHTTTLVLPDGDEVSFSCYYQWTGSWPASIPDSCSCL